MPFKGQSWEFVGPGKKSALPQPLPPILVMLQRDPLLGRICREYLLKQVRKVPGETSPVNMTLILGQELTQEWVENQLMGLSLFGNQEGFLILQAEEIKSKVKDFLLAHHQDITGLFVLFSFQKEDPLIKKLGENGYLMEIEEPKFWEMGQLLDFLCQQLDLNLSRESKDYLLLSVPHTPQDFWQALNQVKLMFPGPGKVELPALQPLISPSRYDHFALSSLFAEKKTEKFYGEILNRGGDFDSMRQLFSFLQSHFLKMVDLGPIQKKDRPNRYEQDIARQSRNWKKEDIQKALRLFGRLEILAKQRHPFLWEKIRLLRMNSL